jgi:cytoskeletal protein RodZ
MSGKYFIELGWPIIFSFSILFAFIFSLILLMLNFQFWGWTLLVLSILGLAALLTMYFYVVNTMDAADPDAADTETDTVDETDTTDETSTDIVADPSTIVNIGQMSLQVALQ